MKRNSALLVLSASLISSSVLAGTMGPVTQQSNRTWVGTLSIGPIWVNSGTTQTFFLAPGIEKTYTANKSTHTRFDAEVFWGLQKRLSQFLQGQLGLAVAATSNASLSGNIWDDADPQFENLTYSYRIQHTHVALKGKLLAEKGHWLIPWLSGSIGVGFNNAHSFDNTPLIFEAVSNPNFASHTETTSSYTVGAGVQKALNPHWQVGVGYEFADWGKTQLGSAAGQTLNSGLSQNHLYSNGVLVSFTYLS